MYQELKLNKQTVGQIIFNSFKPESGKQDLLEWIEFQWSKFQLMTLKTDRLIFFICLSDLTPIFRTLLFMTLGASFLIFINHKLVLN